MNITPHFVVRELMCKCGCGSFVYHSASLRALQRLRDRLGVPLRITSGTRCISHNTAVGGAPNSFHLKGRAFDIVHDASLDPAWLGEIALSSGFGVARRYKTFTHVDTGPARNW